jgi:multidrug efflux pump subunit AcrB
MHISEFSVRQSVLVNLLVILFLVAGGVTYSTMIKEKFPAIDIEEVRVNTVYPGVSPEEIERLITIPIEDEVAGIEGVDDVTSTSSEGFSQIEVDFDTGIEDFPRKVQEVQNKVNRVDDLPEDAETPEIEEETWTTIAIIASLSGNVPESVLKELSEDLEDDLLDIPGVDEVSVMGRRDREIWVEVNPGRLEGYNLSLADVIFSLETTNLDIPAGTLGSGREEFLIRTMGEAEAPEQVERVILRSNAEGGHVYLRDIATVSDTFEEATTIGRLDGEQTISLMVMKSKTGNTVKIVEAVKALKKEYEENRLPEGVKLTLTNDAAVDVWSNLNALYQNGALGLVLVLLVLYVFVGLRPAVLTAIGIPVAFAMSILLMRYFDITINMLSLFGLILVLGIIVDDAIIICENAWRHIEEGKSPIDAAVIGTKEVTWPVVAAVATTMAAFLPLLLMVGTLGKFMGVIPKTVTFALLASLVEAFFILPSHVADFAKPRRSRQDSIKTPKWQQRLTEFYLRLLTFTLRMRYLGVLVAIAIALGALLFAYKFMPFVLFPARDVEEFGITIKMPVGTKLEETERVVQKLENIALEFPEEEVYAVIGWVGRGQLANYDFQAGTHIGQVRLDLTDPFERDRTGLEIVNEFRSKVQAIPGPSELNFLEWREGPPVDPAVEVRIRGDDFLVLREVADEMKGYLTTIDGIRDISDDFEPGKEEARIIIDDDKASLMGLDTATIGLTIRYAIDGGIASAIHDQGDEIEIRVKLGEEYSQDLEDIEDMKFRSREGGLIPFKNFGRIEREPGYSNISRRDRKREVTVSANIDEEVITSVEINRLLQERYKDFSEKRPGYLMSFSGEYQETQEQMIALGKAFGVAILLIYVILGSLFKSFIRPFVVMLAVPFSFIGVVAGFYIMSEPLGLMAIIGTIGLTGIVVNDSLILVDFIDKGRAAGLGRQEAILRAGRLRLRPVILTSVTTIFGLLPLAFGLFGLSLFLTPVAVAIVWGLTVATGLTLLLVPSIYAILDDITNLFRRERVQESAESADDAGMVDW